MDVYRQKSISAIFTELPFIRRSAQCPFVDSLEDANRLQELKDVATGKSCISTLEYRHEFLIRCVLPDDILDRLGATDELLSWHYYSWKVWDVETIFSESMPAEAVTVAEAGIDTRRLNSIADKSSCIPLLKKIATLLGNKGYTFKKELQKGLEEIEQRLFAGIEIDTIKSLRRISRSNDAKIARPRIIPLRVRDQILRRDNYRCIFCGAWRDVSVSLEVHHIIPVSIVTKLQLDRGLESGAENLCTTCFACNRGKSDQLAIEDVDFYIDAFSGVTHPNHGVVELLKIIRRTQSVMQPSDLIR
jgi:hypothetical protein